MSKAKKKINTIMIDIYDDNTSRHTWKGDLSLLLVRSVLQAHANLISENIGQMKLKQDENKVKVFQPGQMPKVNVQ